MLACAVCGDAAAQNLLGNYYSTNIADPRSLAEAFRWHLLAARQGSVFAQGSVAHAYIEGGGVKQDQLLGIEWLRIAADQGEPLALYSLGNIYRRPDITVVERNPSRTYMWRTILYRRLLKEDYTRIPDQKSMIDMIPQRRDRIAAQMTPTEVAEARRLALEWQPKTWRELLARVPQ